jgi:site-specific DNA-methyltransferase (adenine-specific)
VSRLPRNQVLVGDALATLRTLPSGCIDTVISSPPYYGLRNYAVDGQIGLEPTVDAWVGELVAVSRELGRVLKPTGSYWLNLGDSFSRHPRYGAARKGLLLAPERLLLALAREGWLVRNKIIWRKANPVPNPVRDRLTLTYEVIYFLVRSPRYFYDLDAIREPHITTVARRAQPVIGLAPAWSGPLAGGSQDGLRRARAAGLPGHPLGKNPGDVWTVATRPGWGGHHATFPPELVRRPLLATCPERVCAACGIPWQPDADGRPGSQCTCGSGSQPGVVLDPFFGTGTVGLVAEQYGREWLGIELNPKFAAAARERLGQSDSGRASPEPRAA